MHFEEIIHHTIADSVSLIPFLFLTYLIMEWMEHKTGDAAKKIVEKSGRFGPLVGAVLGAFPQCGFSAAGSSLYAGRVITLGTLFAIYLSTSDEMLPVMLSEAVPFPVIGKIILCKIVIGFVMGFLIDLICRKHGREEHEHIGEMCSHDHCHCEEGILKSAIRHTLQVTFFIVLISFVLNLVLHTLGEDVLAELFLNYGILGELTAGLIGMIPNCAASVTVTQLYLEGVLNFGAMLSGLLTGSGVGLLVLYRTNHNWKENVCITGILYIIGTVCGIAVNYMGIVS